MDSLQTAQVVIDSLTKRKAYDIVKIDVKEKTSIADYFVIASARSTTQVKSLAEFCEAEAEKAGAKILRKEGLQDGRWAIIDFGDVILHIFNDETRLFYHLERLWGEGEIIENNDLFSNSYLSIIEPLIAIFGAFTRFLRLGLELLVI